MYIYIKYNKLISSILQTFEPYVYDITTLQVHIQNWTMKLS